MIYEWNDMGDLTANEYRASVNCNARRSLLAYELGATVAIVLLAVLIGLVA